ncbi:MAG: hypothetical protein P9X26_06405 [Candidatus Stygibacter frigidus]|nr:hypothetical protein [Candidatus Stygibacter frigidus]
MKRVFRLKGADGILNLSASFGLFQQVDQPPKREDILMKSAKQINEAMRKAFHEQIEAEEQRAKQK